MGEPKGVLMIDCAPSEVDGEPILRGVIDVGSFDQLLIGPYQREVLPVTSIEEWRKAFKLGEVPDIYLGMRGINFDPTGMGPGRALLIDPVYVIDGQQRWNTAKLLRDEGLRPHLGASVRFKTTEPSERELFQRLNVRQRRLSGNKILQNTADDLPVMRELLQLTTTPSDFVLTGRVTWGQKAREGDLVSAVTFVTVIGELLAHLGSTRHSQLLRLAPALDNVASELTKELVIENTVYFFTLVQELWKLGDIQYRDRSTANKLAFLAGLAKLLSAHYDFWQGERLYVKADDKRKLKSYPVNDPSVVAVVKSGKESVFRDMVNHMNRSRRHDFLRQRGTL